MTTCTGRVCSHGSPSRVSPTHGGKNQISGNQRVSVRRTGSGRAKRGSSPLSLRSQSKRGGHRKRRRPRRGEKARHIGDGWVSPLTVLSIHGSRVVSPIKQLHSHPSSRPWDRRVCERNTLLAFLRSLRSFNSYRSFLPLLLLQTSERRPYNGLVTGRFRLEAIYDQIARWKLTT